MYLIQCFVRSVFLLLITLFSFGIYAQILPDWGTAFPQTEVTTVNITIEIDSLQQMIDTEDNEHYYPATFNYQSQNSTLAFDSVGLRIKGGSSLSADKLSFKISTDEFNNYELSEGMTVMNLVSQLNDPSLMRSKLCHDFYRAYSIPAARTSYVRLYINSEYRGLYLNVEQIDKSFAEKYFHAPGDGNVYKCNYPADLAYISTNPNDYKLSDGWSTERIYDLKTNKSLDDYSGLSQFINVLVNTNIQNLECELPKVFNVESYLKVMAIDVLTGNWDGYAYNKNNFYLYHNRQTNQINFIPYDLDNTFGMDWIGIDWGNRNIYSWAPSDQDRPLFKRILQVPSFRNRFSYYISQMTQDYFTEENITQLCLNWQNLIESAAEEDIYRTLDFGFDLDDFYASLQMAELGESYQWHLPYGIIPYVNERRSNAIAQLENFDEQTAYVQWIEQRPVNNLIIIEADIEGPAASNCQVRYSTDGVNYTTNSILDQEGISQISNDGIFSILLPETSVASDKYYYQLILPDGSFFPCQPAFFWRTPAQAGLFINEAMPLNNSTIADDSGVYEDWIELYNAGISSVNLSGKFISDDSLSWYKFPLPTVTLLSNDFKLVWLDDDHSQGPLHATFKLSPTEKIFLTTMQEGEPRITSLMSNLPSTSDVSLELTVDGGSESAFTSEPTPNASNFAVSVAENFHSPLNFVYPNPANEYVQFFKMADHVELRDALGRLIAEEYNSIGLNTRSVDSGVYFLHLDNIIVRQIIRH